ncbi:MAG: hypothetical protein LUG83_10185, partial [Lachnospiraceae bacterium]|nr:hypothetical protein [Lachnospiraceae bacterium]
MKKADLNKRNNKNTRRLWEAVKIPLLAILVSLIVSGIIITATGCNPFKAYYSLLQGCGLAPKASYAGYKS